MLTYFYFRKSLSYQYKLSNIFTSVTKKYDIKRKVKKVKNAS